MLTLFYHRVKEMSVSCYHRGLSMLQILTLRFIAVMCSGIHVLLWLKNAVSSSPGVKKISHSRYPVLNATVLTVASIVSHKNDIPVGRNMQVLHADDLLFFHWIIYDWWKPTCNSGTSHNRAVQLHMQKVGAVQLHTQKAVMYAMHRFYFVPYVSYCRKHELCQWLPMYCRSTKYSLPWSQLSVYLECPTQHASYLGASQLCQLLSEYSCYKMFPYCASLKCSSYTVCISIFVSLACSCFTLLYSRGQGIWCNLWWHALSTGLSFLSNFAYKILRRYFAPKVSCTH